MIGLLIRHNGGTLFDICEDPKTLKNFTYLSQNVVTPDFPVYPCKKTTEWRKVVGVTYMDTLRVSTIPVQDEDDEDVVVRYLGRDAFEALLRIIDKRTI